MPHRVELSPSGRSKCRACQKNIEKGSVRLGVAVPNPFGDGEATHYYHLECGAWRQPDALLAAAFGEPDDTGEQTAGAQTAGEHATSAAPAVASGAAAAGDAAAEAVDRSVWEGLPAQRRAELGAAAELSRAHHRLRRFVKVERAKTARAHCRHCRETIDKGALRLCLEIIDDGRVDAAGFVHLACARAYAGPVEHVLPHLARADGVTDDDFAEVERALTSA